MTEEVEHTNPLVKKMQRIIPGTTIRLPSRGIFYKNGEIDSEVQDGEIVVHPMTTLDEITIRSPDELFKGTAIEKVVGRCAPQIRKPLELFAKDIDYILVQLRKISYGNTIILNFTCPTCMEKAKEDENTPEHEYSVSIDYFINKSKELNITDLPKYDITLSNSMVIHLRPSKFNEMIKMNQINDETKSPEEIEDIITSSIIAVIDHVDNIRDEKLLKEWLKMIPVKVMEEIVSKIAEANNWGPEFSYHIVCKDCGTKHDISYILNPVSFFTLPASPKTSPNTES